MEARNWGSGGRDLMRRFLARFTPLLPDTETGALWARIKSNREKKGLPITFADAWIVAAAVQLNVPLVTHNADDYLPWVGRRSARRWIERKRKEWAYFRADVQAADLERACAIRAKDLNELLYMERPERFELPTFWFVVSC